MPKPSLRVTGLHVEGLRALRKLDWPENGMGWNGRVPDVVLVGGVNGSGKTTLLELIALAISAVSDDYVSFGRFLKPTSSSEMARAFVEFEFGGDHLEPTRFAVCGETSPYTQVRAPSKTDDSIPRRTFLFDEENPIAEPSHFVVGARNGAFAAAAYGTTKLVRELLETERFAAAQLPGIVYLPHNRELIIPPTSYKGAGRQLSEIHVVHTVERPDDWAKSFEAVLYAARWRDLNAHQAGQPNPENGFEVYEKTFQRFFEGRKRLRWSVEGELFVEITATKERHGIEELSSGEKQVILMAGELFRLWRSGSLILIDEPELHLHQMWQTRLWALLLDFQKERGGQVIVTTQSNHLFRIADPYTTFLLGTDTLE